MAKGKPIKVNCFMHFTESDRTVPIEELTPEEREYCSKKMAATAFPYYVKLLCK